MAKKRRKAKQQGGSGALVAAAIAGGVGAILGLALLGRRGVGGIVNALDGAPDSGSTAADLKTKRRNGPGDRAPTDFRPDPTAPVDKRKRNALAPATMPNPMSAEPAI